MDILYIVGRGSKHNNVELRMSLRSICKFGKGIDRVIVAGYPPDWLSDEVVKITIPDRYSRKHHNLIMCIQDVVKRGIVQGDFLYSSDDHFYVDYVDFNNYPYYIKSPALRLNARKGERGYGYHKSLVETRQLLEKHGLPTANYEQHCNTHMHSEVIKRFDSLLNDSFNLSRGAAPTTLIANAWNTTEFAPAVWEKRADLKMKECTSIDDIRQKIGDRDCFSIGDITFKNGALMEFFKKIFPEPCRYEKKTNGGGIVA